MTTVDLKQLAILLLFTFHAVVISIGGISSTLSINGAKSVKDTIFSQFNWYAYNTGQHKQSWAFFARMPGVIEHFKVIKITNGITEELDTLTLPSAPYMFNQTEFNFIRQMSAGKTFEKYKTSRENYVEYLCKKYTAPPKSTIQFINEFAYFPNRQDADFSWKQWEPNWQQTVLHEVEC